MPRAKPVARLTAAAAVVEPNAKCSRLRVANAAASPKFRSSHAAISRCIVAIASQRVIRTGNLGLSKATRPSVKESASGRLFFLAGSEERRRAPVKPGAMDRASRYATGVALAAVHVGALAAFWPAFFSWSALIVFSILAYGTGVLGVTLCYHRVLTHRSLRLRKPLEYLFAFLGTLALQGDPIRWVAVHRKHHAHADHDEDPHSIRLGFKWAHVDWLYRNNVAMPTDEEIKRYAPDLYADPFYRALSYLGHPAANRARRRALLLWRLAVGDLGYLRSSGLRLPFHLAGQQRCAYDGVPHLSHQRLLDELLVGRGAGLG